ncbi:MAG TPA: flap endonuclease-1 [Thermoplasmata archaeon]|nr:flap endonuclease-1 [Thermoplasmata archaeon]
MGVNLTPIVVRHATSLEALRGRSVAVDGNLELYQFLSVLRTRDARPLMDAQGRVTSHLNGLMFRTTRLLADFGIRPVFVFDGPPPDLKRAEIERRREARAKAEQEYAAAVASGDVATAWSKAVSATRLTRPMIDDAKTLLTLLGIPWVQSPSEGEAEAAFLARRGDVWAASSKDYDSLLFGAPRLVRFLAVGSTEFLPSQGRSRAVPPEVLDLEENLRKLGLTREQLIDAAILVGTDFFEGVKGIGPKTAVKRVREWGSLDRAPPDVRDQLPPDLEAIRAFFRTPPVTEPADLRPARVDEAGILRFLCQERGFNASRVRGVLDRLRAVRRMSHRLEDFGSERG